MKSLIILCAMTLLGVSVVTGQTRSPGRPHRHTPVFDPPPPGPVAQYGDAVSGLTTNQLAAFEAGLEEFEAVETIDEGLGPTFNNVSCVACHSVPNTGGSSALTVTRFGRTTNGHFDPLAALGGSLLQTNAIDPDCQEVVPAEANVVIHRQTTPLYGLGLIEAIPDRTILRNASRRQRDGTSGRAAMVTDIVSGQRRVGRFGWKDQQATLLAFAGDAYLNEMGITSRLFPFENAPNGDTNKLANCDAVADPEDDDDPVTGKADIDVFADFMRLLAPPPPLPMTESAHLGRRVFSQVGCASCHTPMLYTGNSDIAALNHQPVRLYSDLLLHDMGTNGDGIAQADAGERELRTSPLWGLHTSAPYWHDGRAATVEDAITSHGGEAKAVRDRYYRLTPELRQQLLDFLNSL